MPKIINKFFNVFFLLVIMFFLGGCSSLDALKDINDNPEHVKRGDVNNTPRAKAYLEDILTNPENREVKAYNRRAYNPSNRKTLFLYHSFYGFFKNQELEHTLVFTATPKGSEVSGTWMLDADSDLESYKLYATGSNPWEVEEYMNKSGSSKLNFRSTVENILERINNAYSFFGAASVRNLPWYHHLWLSLTPPPLISLVTVLIMSKNSDNCNSAVAETLQWE